mgnify:CR=1 FL=1
MVVYFVAVVLMSFGAYLLGSLTEKILCIGQKNPEHYEKYSLFQMETRAYSRWKPEPMQCREHIMLCWLV